MFRFCKVRPKSLVFFSIANMRNSPSLPLYLFEFYMFRKYRQIDYIRTATCSCSTIAVTKRIENFQCQLKGLNEKRLIQKELFIYFAESIFLAFYCLKYNFSPYLVQAYAKCALFVSHRLNLDEDGAILSAIQRCMSNGMTQFERQHHTTQKKTHVFKERKLKRYQLLQGILVIDCNSQKSSIVFIHIFAADERGATFFLLFISFFVYDFVALSTKSRVLLPTSIRKRKQKQN